MCVCVCVCLVFYSTRQSHLQYYISNKSAKWHCGRHTTIKKRSTQ